MVRVFKCLNAFCKCIAAGDVLFCVQTKTQKAPATFEAREARIKGYSPLIIPKKMGSIQKIQVASLKDFFVFRRLEAPQSLRDSSLKEGASGETASFVVCPETLPYCQSLPYEGGGKPDRA